MKSPVGAELSCKAKNHHFKQEGAEVERGVISYYATLTLGQAATVKEWMKLMIEASNEDIREGRLQRVYQPTLQIIGDGATKLPG